MTAGRAGAPTGVLSAERRRAREALLADRLAALERRQLRRLGLRLPRSLPVPPLGTRPSR
jgi:hypothetical protein